MVRDQVKVYEGPQGRAHERKKFYAQNIWSAENYRVVNVLPNFPGQASRGFYVYEVKKEPEEASKFCLRFQLLKE